MSAPEPTAAEFLLWVDVETTGLNPEQDHLLEIAAVLTTFDADFTPVGRPFSIALGLPDLSVRAIDPAVLAMHSANGLWKECSRSRVTEPEAFACFRRWWWDLRTMGTNVYAAGRSVHFDLGWLKRNDDLWDTLRLHHRRFDLTPIKAFAGLAGYSFSVPEDAHRALPDVGADIELARDLVRLVGGCP